MGKIVPENINEVNNFERNVDPKKIMRLGKQRYKTFDEARIGDDVFDWNQEVIGVIKEKISYEEDPEQFMEDLTNEYGEEEAKSMAMGFPNAILVEGPDLDMFGGRGTAIYSYGVDGGAYCKW